MRPKKPVLIWASNPDEAGDLSFTMSLHMEWAPLPCSTTIEVDEILGLGDLALAILITNGQDGAGGIAERIKRARAHCPVLAIARRNRGLIDTRFVDRAIEEAAGRAELLELARVLSQRKRGPRKAEQPEVAL